MSRLLIGAAIAVYMAFTIYYSVQDYYDMMTDNWIVNLVKFIVRSVTG